MFNNRSRWFDATHALVKQGYEDYSRDLVANALLSLRRDELNDSQREYLIDCLDNLLNSEKPEHSFYMKNERGKKKKATALRDLHAAQLVVEAQSCGLNYDDALEKVASLINEIFSEEMIDIKTVERATTKYKGSILKNYKEIPSLKRLFD